MTKYQEFLASIGVGVAGIATWAIFAAYIATKLAYPILL